jgi:hypothetical protein
MGGPGLAAEFRKTRKATAAEVLDAKAAGYSANQDQNRSNHSKNPALRQIPTGFL